jgi:hypothetical protein
MRCLAILGILKSEGLIVAKAGVWSRNEQRLFAGKLRRDPLTGKSIAEVLSLKVIHRFFLIETGRGV